MGGVGQPERGQVFRLHAQLQSLRQRAYIVMALYSYGLYIYGLYSYGLRSPGLYSYSPYENVPI